MDVESERRSRPVEADDGCIRPRFAAGFPKIKSHTFVVDLWIVLGAFQDIDEFLVGEWNAAGEAPAFEPTNIVSKGAFYLGGVEIGNFLADEGIDAGAFRIVNRGDTHHDTFGPYKEYFAFERTKLPIDLADVAEVADGALARLTCVVAITLDEVRVIERDVGCFGIFVVTDNPANVHGSSIANDDGPRRAVDRGGVWDTGNRAAKWVCRYADRGTRGVD